MSTPNRPDVALEPLRARIREFLRDNAIPEFRGVDRSTRLARQRQWAALLYDNGLAGPAWPTDYGGMGLNFAGQLAYFDEFAPHTTPAHPGNGPSIAGPTLIRFASDEQKRRYLPAMLRAEEVWAQGFSEPGAGSDLQSLATTATRHGDHYVVRGEKIWSTYADVAEKMFALVRTGPPGSGASGISYLLIDLRADGVHVRPIRDATGETRFSQIHFDDVAVPVCDRVGAENGGWPLARATLGNERLARSLVQATAYRRRMSALAKLLAARGAMRDPIIRDRVARCEIGVRILYLNAVRAIAALVETGVPGPASSIARLYHSALEQQFYLLAVDALGPTGLVARGPQSVNGGSLLKGFLHSRASTIGAGTAEMQRNTIAERILGLPPEPRGALPAGGPG